MADIDVHYDGISVTTDPTTVNVHADPTTVNFHADPTTVDIVGLDNTHNTITLETPKPLQAESKATLLIPEPIRTESKAELDVKPLAFDQCLNIRFGPLPPTCLRQPYQQHFGITLFGVEILGFNLTGESQLVVDNLPSKPQIAWGGEKAAGHETLSKTIEHDGSRSAAGGLRIRLDG